MTTGSLPLHLEVKVKQVVSTVTEEVRAKGLEAVLSFELWRLRQDALKAMLDHDATLARHVIERRYEFYRRIRAA
jgi:hypothetical protein